MWKNERSTSKISISIRKFKQKRDINTQQNILQSISTHRDSNMRTNSLLQIALLAQIALATETEKFQNPWDQLHNENDQVKLRANDHNLVVFKEVGKVTHNMAYSHLEITLNFKEYIEQANKIRAIVVNTTSFHITEQQLQQYARFKTIEERLKTIKSTVMDAEEILQPTSTYRNKRSPPLHPLQSIINARAATYQTLKAPAKQAMGLNPNSLKAFFSRTPRSLTVLGILIFTTLVATGTAAAALIETRATAKTSNNNTANINYISQELQRSNRKTEKTIKALEQRWTEQWQKAKYFDDVFFEAIDATKTLEIEVTRFHSAIEMLRKGTLVSAIINLPQLDHYKRELLTKIRQHGLETLEDLSAHDMLNLPFSLIQEQEEYVLIIHVPTFPPGHLQHLHQHIPLPWAFLDNNTNLVLVPRPYFQYLGLDDESRAHTLWDEATISSCNTFKDIWLCENSRNTINDLSSSCLGSLFSTDQEKINEQCPIFAINAEETAYQITPRNHLLILPRPTNINYYCPSKAKSYSSTIQGLISAEIDIGCRVTTQRLSIMRLPTTTPTEAFRVSKVNMGINDILPMGTTADKLQQLIDKSIIPIDLHEFAEQALRDDDADLMQINHYATSANTIAIGVMMITIVILITILCIRTKPKVIPRKEEEDGETSSQCFINPKQSSLELNRLNFTEP